MTDLVQANWPLLVVALLVGLLVAWWILVASRRTKVERERRPDDAGAARRNQALIDAPPAAAPAADIPPPTPAGLAGVGEAVAAAAEPVPAAAEASADDLTRIKGLGPKLAEQLRALGVTGLAQIAAWDDAEIDRIDAQLGRFQGRIRRDAWPDQARLLVAGDTAGYEAKFGRL
ncbi:MAG TPA: helix-hairpin-helix domain-containing protein [Croceibacterium sp.]|nr:helix-hairpin-helix domain-containing protein [Croceibacterium sp.]